MTKHFNTQAIWSSTPFTSFEYEPLTTAIEVDVAIIGGGITGISTAWQLSKTGKKVAVLEAGKVGMGTTGSSTGNLYVPTGQLHQVLSKHGKKALEAVVNSRAVAFQFIEDRISQYNIDCAFKRVPWYYFTSDKNQNEAVEKEFYAAKVAGLTPLEYAPAGFPFPVESIAVVHGQAQFNPLQYVQQLAAAIAGPQCRIYENTKVTGINDGNPCVLETSGGQVRAKKTVQATHTPKGIYTVHAEMDVYREYALAAKVKGTLPAGGIYWQLEGGKMFSIRTYSDSTGTYLIVLDDSHKTGHKQHTEESFAAVEKHLRTYFDVDGIQYLWAAQNYKPDDYLPYIGTSPLEENIYIATGFAADGLVTGTAASFIISDLIEGRENKWAKVFDPKRFTPLASAKKFIEKNLDVASHLIKDYVFKKDGEEISSIQIGEGKIVEFQNHKAAAFRDEIGRLHLVSAVCPHMGCSVAWNNAERSWDCPCHGSRFSVSGEVLEGPAIKNLKNYRVE
jgi:glycine/D-amino acid oxidase-like deaminating enzyme/nitrite reductase/ring-hydroxylating ferredoxin subunit